MRWAFSGFLTIVGMLVLVFATVFTIQAKASESWPSVEGVMEKCDVETRVSSSSSRSSSTSYLPDIEYSYEVDGQRFTGTRFEIVERGMNKRSEIEERLAPFPTGRSVLVFYDPDDPTSSVILRGIPEAMGIAWFMGGFATLAGIVVWFVMAPDRGPERRRRRRAAREADAATN